MRERVCKTQGKKVLVSSSFVPAQADQGFFVAGFAVGPSHKANSVGVRFQGKEHTSLWQTWESVSSPPESHDCCSNTGILQQSFSPSTWVTLMLTQREGCLQNTPSDWAGWGKGRIPMQFQAVCHENSVLPLTNPYEENT